MEMAVAQTSSIEWTDATWNPVRGCTKISPGCVHCYAETFSERFRGVAAHPYEQGFDLRLVPEKLLEPLKWPARKRVFVNSMSDLFHLGVPDSYIEDVGMIMSVCPWHTFQVLTKRAERLRDMVNGKLAPLANLDHIWWGVSVEDRRFGIPRIEHLQRSNVAVRFLSIEPLLEDLGDLDLSGIHWVIVGGESGHGARAMKEDWVLSLKDHCQRRHIPFFFKQWGGIHKKRNGRLLRGKVYDESPAASDNEIPSRITRDRLSHDLLLHSVAAEDSPLLRLHV
jgi:protein gp37